MIMINDMTAQSTTYKHCPVIIIIIINLLIATRDTGAVG